MGAPLRETDIRPHHLNSLKEEAYARDVARLLRRKAEFLEVPCPACHGTRAEKRWEKWDLDYLDCTDCRTLYVSPRPSPDLIEEYYRTSETYEYWNKWIFPASEPTRREHIVRPRVNAVIELCKQHHVPPGVLVEVGAGFGTFCVEARERRVFDRIIAIEPTPSLADTCIERGLEVIAVPIEHVSPDSIRADVVAAFEVIEHLFDPSTFISACSRILSPGGLLVLTCPNGRGFEVETLGAVADTIDTEHLNYFNPDSLARLAGSLGFDVLATSTPGVLDADIVRNKILAGKFDVSAQPFLRTVLLERWNDLGVPFQEFLRDHKLSTHMWLVARNSVGPQASSVR